MYSLAVSTLDSPAVDPRSNPDSGKILMSESFKLYIIYEIEHSKFYEDNEFIEITSATPRKLSIMTMTMTMTMTMKIFYLT